MKSKLPQLCLLTFLLLLLTTTGLPLPFPPRPQHPSPISPDEALRAGIKNVGELILPDEVKATYKAAIDPTTGFAYFTPSHGNTRSLVAKIDLRGRLPVLVPEGPGDDKARGTGISSLAIEIDTTDRDPLKHYLYVGTQDSVIKMSPGDATHGPQILAVMHPTSSSGPRNCSTVDTSSPDPAQHYAYFCTNKDRKPAVLRVRLSDLSDQGSELLDMTGARYAGIDLVRHYAYFTNTGFTGGARPTAPPQISKVNLKTFHDGGHSTATYTMDSNVPGDGVGRPGADYPSIDEALVVDDKHGYAYLGSYNTDQSEAHPKSEIWPYNQSVIIRVKLGEGEAFPPHPLTTLDLRVGERQLAASVIDVAHGNAYFGTDNCIPGHVYMIHVGDGTKPMKEIARLDLNLGTVKPEDIPRDGVPQPGKATYWGETYLRASVLDAKHNAIYFGTDSDPEQIIKVGINGKW